MFQKYYKNAHIITHNFLPSTPQECPIQISALTIQASVHPAAITSRDLLPYNIRGLTTIHSWSHTNHGILEYADSQVYARLALR